ncbi:MAG: hypothetical protein KIT80_21865 [Chitinophagaceae bacterium]|nr:hypothetical protein [Chitinophagaceae bacterium]MCW5929583.1 hypothetical protein [Chitinophagaceae bacterium]
MKEIKTTSKKSPKRKRSKINKVMLIAGSSKTAKGGNGVKPDPEDLA